MSVDSDLHSESDSDSDDDRDEPNDLRQVSFMPLGATRAREELHRECSDDILLIPANSAAEMRPSGMQNGRTRNPALREGQTRTFKVW